MTDAYAAAQGVRQADDDLQAHIRRMSNEFASLSDALRRLAGQDIDLSLTHGTPEVVAICSRVTSLTNGALTEARPELIHQLLADAVAARAALASAREVEHGGR